MYSTLLLANNPEATVNEILAIDLNEFTIDFLNGCYTAVSEEFNEIGGGSYYASKERQSVIRLIERLSQGTYRED